MSHTVMSIKCPPPLFRAYPTTTLLLLLRGGGVILTAAARGQTAMPLLWSPSIRGGRVRVGGGESPCAHGNRGRGLYRRTRETIYIIRALRKNTTASTTLRTYDTSSSLTPQTHHAILLDTYTPCARTKRESRGQPRAVAASNPPPAPPPSSSDLYPIVSRARTTPFLSTNLPRVAGASAVPGDAVVALAAAGVASARVAAGAEATRDATGTRASTHVDVSAAPVPVCKKPAPTIATATSPVRPGIARIGAIRSATALLSPGAENGGRGGEGGALGAGGGAGGGEGGDGGTRGVRASEGAEQKGDYRDGVRVCDPE